MFGDLIVTGDEVHIFTLFYEKYYTVSSYLKLSKERKQILDEQQIIQLLNLFVTKLPNLWKTYLKRYALFDDAEYLTAQ